MQPLFIDADDAFPPPVNLMTSSVAINKGSISGIPAVSAKNCFK